MTVDWHWRCSLTWDVPQSPFVPGTEPVNDQLHNINRAQEQQQSSHDDGVCPCFRLRTRPVVPMNVSIGGTRVAFEELLRVVTDVRHVANSVPQVRQSINRSRSMASPRHYAERVWYGND